MDSEKHVKLKIKNDEKNQKDYSLIKNKLLRNELYRKEKVKKDKEKRKLREKRKKERDALGDEVD